MCRSVSVNTLTYNGKIVGYRLMITENMRGRSKYYDLNVGVAEKYSLARGMVGIEVPLIDYDGLLLSKQEKEYGMTVEDMSNNIEFLKSVVAMRTNKRTAVDLKAKAEEDRRKALQMDRFNRLLKVCLNVITVPPYIKNIGSYSFIALNLDTEIDSILVSQGVFTTDKSLNKRLKVNILEYMRKLGYTYIDVTEYSKSKGKNKVLDTILSRYNTRDILLKDSK